MSEKINVGFVWGLGYNRGTKKNGAQVDASHLLCYGVSLIQSEMDCNPFPLGEGWGEAFFLFQNHIDEGGYVAHVDFTVAVDIAHFVAVVRSAENLVDEGSHVAHVDFTVGVDVAQ